MGYLGLLKQATIAAGIYPQARMLHRLLHPNDRRLFREHQALLRQFVRPGALTFDVGANIGTRTEILLSLGARVVAFEPQPICAREVAAHGNERLIVVQKAIGSAEGTAKLYFKGASVLASLKPDWKDIPSKGARDVEVTTLDKAIEQFGVPEYCKLDIEGFEPEALRGLSHSIPVLSLEYHCSADGVERTRECLARLSQLGSYVVNLTAEHEAKLILPEWLPVADFARSFPDITGGHFWGDLFVAAKELLKA